MKNKIKHLPEISVIICAYNHEKWIERCIRSIKNQTEINQKDIEVIVVNDFSKDKTNLILRNFKNVDNIKIINNKKNLGLPNSINKAIRLSLGRYIVRVDSDDYVSRKFLSLCKLYLNMNREYQAVAVDYFKVDNNEKVLSKINCFKKEIACGIMFRKESLIEVGLYNERFKMREGHELRLRFKKKFKIGRLEFPLYKYRQHMKNRTKKKREVKKYNKLLRKEK